MTHHDHVNVRSDSCFCILTIKYDEYEDVFISLTIKYDEYEDVFISALNIYFFDLVAAVVIIIFGCTFFWR